MFNGAKLFKKYWHVKGEFKYRKLNKKCISDLKQVIKDSKNFSKIHIYNLKNGFIIIPTFVYCIWNGLKRYFNKKDENMPFSGNNLLFFFYLENIVINGYTLMIHQYNRITARRQIYNLSKMSFKKKNF